MTRFAIAAFYFLLLALGVWWLVLFTRRRVKAEFGALPAGITPSAPPLPPGPPVSIILIAGLILLAVPGLLLLGLALPLPAAVLGQVFSGWPAKLFYVAFAGIHLAIGVGLLKLRPWARLAAIAYYLFGAVNAISFALVPGALDQVMAAYLRFLPPNTPRPTLPPHLLAVLMVPSLLFLGVLLWLLITRKPAFEHARRAALTAT